MHDLVVDADEHGARKAVDDGRGRTRAPAGDDTAATSSSSFVVMPGANAPLQRVQRFADDGARAAQPFPVGVRFDRHGASALRAKRFAIHVLGLAPLVSEPQVERMRAVAHDIAAHRHPRQAAIAAQRSAAATSIRPAPCPRNVSSTTRPKISQRGPDSRLLLARVNPARDRAVFIFGDPDELAGHAP